MKQQSIKNPTQSNNANPQSTSKIASSGHQVRGAGSNDSPQEVDRWWHDTMKALRDEHEEKYEGKQQPNATFNDFRLAKTLGSGSFGRVVLVKHIPSSEYFAMKILIKEKIVKMRQVDHTIAEKRILYSINFPFLVKLRFHFKDNSNLYLVLDFEAGGEMFTYLRKQRKFSESQAKFYCAQVVMAFEYLHDLNILYRDLKPENMLVSMDGYTKVTDLGFAKKLHPDHTRTYTLCGTPEYLAPEVIKNRGYGKSVDWWTVGILIFEMTAGNVPFYSKKQQHMYQKIVQGNLYLPSHFSPELKDLCTNILQVDTSKRYGCLREGVKDIKDHPWFHSVKWNSMYYKRLKAPFIPEVRGMGDASNFPAQKEEKLYISLTDKHGEAFLKF